MQATKVFEQIQEHASKNKDDRAVVLPKMRPGQFCAQGDISIVCISGLPADCRQIDAMHQIAPGTSKGSRHTIDLGDLKNTEFYAFYDPTPLHGPIIRVHKPIWNRHPEHADLQWQPGWYAVTYQRSLAEELRRVAD